MFEWKNLGVKWRSEQAYQVLEILKQNHIRYRMPADDMFFNSPFHLPHPDRRWAIQVRQRDVKRASALLAREGLIPDAAGDDHGTEETSGWRCPDGMTKPVLMAATLPTRAN